jgi:hypothetical protein
MWRCSCDSDTAPSSATLVRVREHLVDIVADGGSAGREAAIERQIAYRKRRNQRRRATRSANGSSLEWP